MNNIRKQYSETLKITEISIFPHSEIKIIKYNSTTNLMRIYPQVMKYIDRN